MKVKNSYSGVWRVIFTLSVCWIAWEPTGKIIHQPADQNELSRKPLGPSHIRPPP